MENDESNTITITIDESMDYGNYMYDNSGNITTTPASSITWNSVTFTGTGPTGTIEEDFSFIDFNGKELIDFMPNLEKINEMCSMYPGLKIAFEHFKTIYSLVHDDYLERKNSEHDY